MLYPFKKIRALVILTLFLGWSGFVQSQNCTGCSTVIAANGGPAITLNAGQSLCINAGISYTGAITLNGGTLCNSGTVTSVVFNRGTFNNYGTYMRTGVLNINNTGKVVMNLFDSGRFLLTGNLNQNTNNASDSLVINNNTNGSVQISGDVTVNKGWLKVRNGALVAGITPKEIIFSIGGQFNVSNSGLDFVNLSRAYVNINKTMSLDGRVNKTITNFGTFNVNSSFNIGGNGQNIGSVTITNRGRFNILDHFNSSYNNGTVNVYNVGGTGNVFSIGKSLTLSKDNNIFFNGAQLDIGLDLNVERGSFTNSGIVNTRDVDVKFGTLTNNYKLTATRDVITSNAQATINNNGFLNVAREFNNKATINLGQASLIYTKNYYNIGNNAIITGPSDPPDTLSYGKIIISGYSENNGFIEKKVLIHDQSLVPGNNNVNYGFDNVVNANRIGSGTFFAAKSVAPGSGGPPISINCSAIQALYTVGILAGPTTICSGQSANLSAQFYNLIPITIPPFPPFFPNPITITLINPVNLPSNSYTWSPASALAGSATQQNQVVSPNTTTNYVVSVNYLGCIFTANSLITVNAATVSISANLPTPICLPVSGVVLTGNVTLSGNATLQWYNGNSAILGATAPIYNPIGPGVYTLRAIIAGCPTVISNQILVYPPFSVNITASPAAFCQNNPITLSAVLSPAFPGTTYQWFQGSTNTGATGNTYQTTVPNTYYAIATTPGGCTATSNVANLQAAQPVIANAGPDQIYTGTPVSIGGSPACATAGVPPYTYLWSTNSGFVSGNVNQCANTVTPSSTITYTLTVTDASGCQATDDVTVINNSTILKYIVPKKNIDGGYQVSVNNNVYFMFEEEYRTSTLSYKIYDFNPSAPNVQVPISSCTNLAGAPRNLGDNRYVINLPTCATLAAAKMYLMEIQNDKNEKFYFKFLY